VPLLLLYNWCLVPLKKSKHFTLDILNGVKIITFKSQHWIANNLLGLAFAVNGVELLALNNVATGVTLLGGLFFYDVFWVFGTDVMVTVAKSFEAPIKCN
jgi:minor histocompatibility antigen H13